MYAYRTRFGRSDRDEDRRVTKMTPRLENRPPKPRYYAIAHDKIEDKRYVCEVEGRFRLEAERAARRWAHSRGWVVEAVYAMRLIQRKSGVQPKTKAELWAEKQERYRKF